MKIFNFIMLGLLVIVISSCAPKKPKDEFAAFRGLTDQQILINGEKLLAKGNYDEAVKNFEALDALYPFGKVAEQGQLDVVYAYYKNGDLDSTIAGADRYIHLYPRGKYADYAYYMKGLANFERSDTWMDFLYTKDPSERDLSAMRDAFINFNDLIRLFPDSKYAPDAHKRMLYIRNTVAGHELKAAEFYLKRKVYVAAANRAGYVVQHFQGAPQVKPALKIMIKSYKALGATKQENDAVEVFKLNYPYDKIK